MKAVSFNIGDKIVTIKNGKLCRGVVKNVYEVTPQVLCIESEDGTVEKVLARSVAPDPKTETQEEIALLEKPEITITPDEFREIACRVIYENAKNRSDSLFVMAKLHKALFIESCEND
jgi:hypothetical protein